MRHKNKNINTNVKWFVPDIDNLETWIQISRSWRISWQNQWLFLQGFSYVGCTHIKTSFHKKLTLFMVSFALTTKKKSLKSLIALTFNLAFTRAYSESKMMFRAARQENWLRVCKSVADLCIKHFLITTRSATDKASPSLVWKSSEVHFSASSLCQSHDLRVPKRIRLLYTLWGCDSIR